jgi:hypothetical protein
VTLEDFVAAARAGRIMVEGGAMRDGLCESEMVPLDATDAEAVTIEAYRDGAMGFEVPWGVALAQVTELLS